jgi:hypothetical protein
MTHRFDPASLGDLDEPVWRYLQHAVSPGAPLGRGFINIRLRVPWSRLPALKLVHAESEDVARSGAGRAALEALWVMGTRDRRPVPVLQGRGDRARASRPALGTAAAIGQDGAMRAVVAYESMYGNTRQVAEAVAAGLEPLGEVEVVSVNQGDAGAADSADVLVVGGPTHMHGLATSMSRRQAAQAAEEEEDVSVEPGAADGPGLRKWLAQRSGDGRPAAAFDTRLDRSPVLTGAAARGIARRLRRRGFHVVAGPESFLVEDSEGPLADGELDRARTWGESLVGQLGARG